MKIIILLYLFVSLSNYVELPVPTDTDCTGAEVYVVDEDFGSGAKDPYDQGFSFATAYGEDREMPLGPGTFVITHRAAAWQAPGDKWLDIGDSMAYQLVFSGKNEAALVWEVSKGICPGLPHEFTVDIANLADTSGAILPLPNLDFLVDGVIVGQLGAIPQDGQWHTYTFSLIPEPTQSVVRFSLFNNTASISGNDFVLDNLRLQSCGPEVSIAERDARAHCIGDELRLQVTTENFFVDPWIVWQVSTNGGLDYLDYGQFSQTDTLLVNDVPPNALFRAGVAPTREAIEIGGCIAYSEPLTIDYLPITECSDDIIAIGGLCQGVLGQNIIIGGDFGSGQANVLLPDPGFAPGYTYQENPPPNDGFYTVTNNTATWGDFAVDWLDFEDNSDDPQGYMMVVNATAGRTGLFFEQTLSLCANTTYQFSADIINVQPAGNNFILPDIAFLVNGQPLYVSESVPEDEVWHTYGFTFTTGPEVSEINLALRNNAPGGIGNDFAMDNISLRPCGPELSVRYDPVCAGDPVLLRASVGLPNYAIQWLESIDGGISWMELSGETDSLLYLENPEAGTLFSFRAAEFAQQLSNPSCRAEAAPVEIVYLSVAETLIDTVLCYGDFWEGIPITSDTQFVAVLSTANGCESIVDTRIKMVGSPFSIMLIPEGPIQVIEPGEQIRLELVAEMEPISVVWSPAEGLSCTDCPNPVAAPVRTTEYRLDVLDVYGCPFGKSITIEVEDLRNLVFIPNVFSPNGDGLNDRFEISGSSKLAKIDRLLIFDRWGGLVFDRGLHYPGDPTAAWDGTLSGDPCNQGVYVYIVELSFSDGERGKFSGELTLLR